MTLWQHATAAMRGSIVSGVEKNNPSFAQAMQYYPIGASIVLLLLELTVEFELSKLCGLGGDDLAAPTQ